MLVQKDISNMHSFTSKVSKAGEEWKADESKVTKVNSKTVTTILMSLKLLEANRSLLLVGSLILKGLI